jgi:hypothetical protein
MSDFTQIDRARKVLGLGERATLEEIKDAYRELSLKYHPDRCKDSDKRKNEEMAKSVNWSKNVLLTYCAGYRYSFREKDVRINAMDNEYYEHLKRFYDGLFGNLDL